MAGSRALPDLVSRIRVDSTGVDQAVGSMISSFGRADVALAGVAAGLGIIAVGAKSMLDIYEKQHEATNSLKQAVDAHNASLGVTDKVVVDVTKQHDALIKTQNAANLSQMAYTAAVKAHGANSIQAQAAAIHLQDAHIKLTAAQEALTHAQDAGSMTLRGNTINLQQYQEQIDSFIRSNRAYISDQAEVIGGYAKLTRAGIDQSQVQLDMNRAIDIAALKHISLSEAVDLVNQAEHGRLRGLIDLGISTTKYTDAQGNLVAGSKNVQLAFEELDQRTKRGRDTLTETQQISNRLSMDWQDLAKKGGPVLETELDLILRKVDDIYNAFDRIGKDDHLWATISNRLVDMAKGLRSVALQLGIAQPVGADYLPGGSRAPGTAAYDAENAKEYSQAYTGTPDAYLPAGSGAPYGFDPRNGFAWARPGNGPGQTPPGSAPGTGTREYRQYGGRMIPGKVYSVGESQAETVVMDPSGGGATVIPDGGGSRSSRGGDTYHFHQVQTDPWQTANEISWTKKTTRI